MRLLIPVPIIGDIANPNITYDLSVNFSTMPQPQHHDDHNHDGAGGCILNHYLHKPAMVIFVHNADDTLQWYRFMEEGCVYMFHKTLRMMASHGVYPLDGVSGKVTKLGLAACKMTSTWRIGDPNKADIETHDAWLVSIQADQQDDAAEGDDDDDEDEASEEASTDPDADAFKTPKSKPKPKAVRSLNLQSQDDQLPNGWKTSGVARTFPHGTWIQHHKLWSVRAGNSSAVLEAGACFEFGEDSTLCKVLVLAVGVFLCKSKRRVTVLCTFKKHNDPTWEPPLFHSANAMLCSVRELGLSATIKKFPARFTKAAVVELCEETSGREAKTSVQIWKDMILLHDAPPSKLPRRGGAAGDDGTVHYNILNNPNRNPYRLLYYI